MVVPIPDLNLNLNLANTAEADGRQNVGSVLNTGSFSAKGFVSNPLSSTLMIVGLLAALWIYKKG